MSTITGGPGRDRGFTLTEVLIVMVIVGILAAIAVPVFLTQRAKSHDTSTISDVTRLGKELATFYVDGQGSPTLDFTSDPEYVYVDDGSHHVGVRLSNGTARPTSGYAAGLDSDTGWCVSLTDPQGAVKQYRFSAKGGLDKGGC